MERFFSLASVILPFLSYVESKRMRVNNDIASAINSKSESNPSLHPNVTYLNISMYVRDMYAFSEKEMTFRMKYNFNLRWREPRLKFDPSMKIVDAENKVWVKINSSDSSANSTEMKEEHEISSISTDLDVDNLSPFIWFPDLYIRNQVPANYKHLNYEHGVATLYPDGHIVFYKTVTSSMRCRMNLRRLPFDTQHCSALFESSKHGLDDQKIEWKPIPGFARQFSMDNNITLDNFYITGRFYNMNSFALTLTL